MTNDPQPDHVTIILGDTAEESAKKDAAARADGHMRIKFYVPGYLRQQRERYAHPEFSTAKGRSAEREWLVAGTVSVFSIRPELAQYLLSQPLDIGVDGEAAIIRIPRDVADQFEPAIITSEEAVAYYDSKLPAFKRAQKKEAA